MINRITVICISLFLFFCCYGQQTVNFKHLTVNEGLVSNHINTIVKDEMGFLWFGTNTGLSRYDGHRFKSYSNRPNNKTSLINNAVLHLFTGFDQKLWLRTNKGNCIYDHASDSFVWNVDSVLKDKGFVGGEVRKIVLSGKASYVLYANGNLYCSGDTGTKKKASLYDADIKGKITDISLDSVRHVLLLVSDHGEVVSLDSRNLQPQQRTTFTFERMVESSDFQLFVDSFSGIWVYAKNFPFGALYYQTLGSKAAVFRQQGGTYSVNNNTISNIQQLNHTIWLATDHGGINVFDLQTGAINYLVHDQTDISSLPYNSTTAMYRDDEGIMWVGTYKGGVSYYHEDLNYFSLYQHQVGYPESLPFNDINCFVEDKKGIIWIGTNGGGLLRFDPKSQTFRSYRHDDQDDRSLGSNVVVSLHIDEEENLWVGTYHGGLNKMEDGGFRRFLHASDSPSTINDNCVWSVFQDSEARFWIGLLSGGIDFLDKSSGRFKRFKSVFDTDFNLSRNAKIIEDSRRNIWIGTSNGVARLSPDGAIAVYNEGSEQGALTNNVVSDLLEDRMGNIWVATQTGINIISENTFTYLSTAQGLIDNVVVGLVMDDFGDIWATASAGISRIQYIRESDSYSIQRYDRSDGLQSSNFNERAIYKLKDGRLLFGGSEGFNMYKPQPISRKNWHSPAVVDFRIPGGGISNNHAQELIREWLSEAREKQHIRVPHQLHTFTLLLTDFDFIARYESKMQYMLKGLGNDWLDVENMEITFSNLSAGNYTLLIRGVDHNGAYSSPVSFIEITKLAPWWRTHVAYLLYMMMIGGILLFFRKMEKMRARTRFNLLQAEEKARHAKEMEELRTRFFTNVSHEFRTPISLIISPVQKLRVSEKDVGRTRYLDIIERNASSLLNLVNQLLDFNSIEKNEHSLKKSYGDVSAFIRRAGEQFETMAQHKHICYSIHVPTTLEAYLDFDKLERIVLNLLSNAFKFTDAGGQICLHCSLEQHTEKIRLEVSDTGIGVPKEMQSRVFERYFQVHDRWNAGEKGSGLGLSIVKEFVRLMAGRIDFASEIGKGTTVKVWLPRLVLPDTTIDIQGEGSNVTDNKHPASRMRKEADSGMKSGHLLRVMVVEDHADFAFYLQDNLGHYFQVDVYHTAEDAWKAMFPYSPDIIVADLHLPGQSGIELCKQIRSNGRTKHIPFVLITAAGTEEKQIEALRQGATDFISKPFSFDVFLSKIKGFVEQQEQIEKHYKRQVDVNVAKADVVNEDERFVLEMTRAIEDHLHDENFSVEALASQMHMTRVGLYKKVLSITGFTPIEFIRNIRLNKALDLLKNSQMTVSEISYEVGFGTPKQFSKYFKNFYGELPSSYRK
jgi:signal transduction histidine kinase/ligand-binding sensor domain-containing protein/DNA-binding response OmpR family regulator